MKCFLKIQDSKKTCETADCFRRFALHFEPPPLCFNGHFIRVSSCSLAVKKLEKSGKVKGRKVHGYGVIKWLRTDRGGLIADGALSPLRLYFYLCAFAAIRGCSIS